MKKILPVALSVAALLIAVSISYYFFYFLPYQKFELDKDKSKNASYLDEKEKCLEYAPSIAKKLEESDKEMNALTQDLMENSTDAPSSKKVFCKKYFIVKARIRVWPILK